MEVLQEAWDKREGPAVFATVSSDTIPNAVYVGEIVYEPEIGLVIADNYFHKTRRNIINGTRGSVLFLTEDSGSYQAKGTIEYHTQGPVFDRMQKWHNPKHPGVAATVVKVDELYAGAERLV